MMIFHARLAVLLAALALVLIACAGEKEAPPCTPLEGETGDPCEGDAGAALAQFSPPIPIPGPTQFG